ncbi:acyl carrier protein 2, mitochondrial-like [Ananas comosus]|uniref:Acyl carrier protein n=1 Tax=Ananas comosus TaxID=4615 RepID=A0A6P5GUF4_ANACO|nr:acyl carrier protein 2, mitochondrial-like [Ananas comosus]
MQATRNAIHLLRSLSSTSPICAHGGRRGGLLYAAGSRAFAQHAAAAASSALDKHEATDRVLGLLRSIPFVDPAKLAIDIFHTSAFPNFRKNFKYPLVVSSTASFKTDLNLDMLDNVEVIAAVEEEFAVEIPNSEAEKFSTTAQLIDYIAGHPQAR